MRENGNNLAIHLDKLRHKMMLCRMIEWAALWGIVGGLLTAAVQIAMWVGRWPYRTEVAGVLVVSAMLGALAALFRGCGRLEAARFVDARAQWDEQVATAAELLQTNADTPAAVFLYGKAAGLLAAKDTRGVSLFRRGAATAGATGLVAVLCLVLTFLPDLSSSDRTSRIVLDGMTGQGLSRAIQLASQAHPSQKKLLDETLRAVELADQAQLDRLVAELRRQGVDVRKYLADKDVTANSMGGKDVPIGKTEGDDRPTEAAAVKPAPRSSSHQRVWDPLYADRAGLNSEVSSRQSVASTQAYEDAWARARARAAEKSRVASLPREYKRMIQEFFQQEE